MDIFKQATFHHHGAGDRVARTQDELFREWAAHTFKAYSKSSEWHLFAF